MEQLQQEAWMPLCFAEKNQKLWSFIFEQLLEPYTNKMMKWIHFLKNNSLLLRIEPKWFKIIKDHITINEIGKYMVEYDKLQSNNDSNNSPFLINCQCCEYNISRKKNTNTGCFIYIEKNIASTLQERWEKDKDGVKYIKPYSTLQNIDKRNDSVYKKSKIQNESNNIDYMVIDKEESILRSGAKLWLKNILEEMGIYTMLENFVETNFIDFVDKELILQIGGVIQKGLDLNLDGFFGIEIFAKNSNIEKFIDLRTDVKILNWLIDYSKIGSVQRELDDQCYMFLNCINTMLDLKNIKLLINNKEESTVVLMREVKLPALKKELIRCKHLIKEVVIKYANIVINEYALRWNYNPIEGAYRKCFKEISNNINRIDIVLLDYVKDCIIECNGANVTIYWKESFRLINNEISMSRNVTSSINVSVRNSIDEILDYVKMEEDDNEITNFKLTLLDIATTKLNIMILDNILREVTRGIINEKWMNSCKKASFKNLKRKKRMEAVNMDDEGIDEDVENLRKTKNRKKIKNLIKIDLENNMKNDVFSLGSSSRHRIGNILLVI
ncbi:hypothetical protein C1646_755188 [Rhizophagus diaphanus]|nr:hypothetical protein C1646_755188 [Rhizophagus diaphanus] [Rhizophagus sp. MUCL 43196]